MLIVLKELIPLVGLGWLHVLTVANMLNLGKLFLTFSSLVSSHNVIASESDVNTKSEKCDWSIRWYRSPKPNDFKSSDAASWLGLACWSGENWDSFAEATCWIETRPRFKPQLALRFSQTFENSDISVCFFVWSCFLSEATWSGTVAGAAPKNDEWGANNVSESLWIWQRWSAKNFFNSVWSCSFASVTAFLLNLSSGYETKLDQQ